MNVLFLYKYPMVGGRFIKRNILSFEFHYLELLLPFLLSYFPFFPFNIGINFLRLSPLLSIPEVRDFPSIDGLRFCTARDFRLLFRIWKWFTCVLMNRIRLFCRDRPLDRTLFVTASYKSKQLAT